MATIDDPKNPYTIIAALTRENERQSRELAAVVEVLSEGCEGPCAYGPCIECDCENEPCDIRGDEDKFCVRCLIEKRMKDARAALEAQADQLKQARAFLQALSSGMYEPEIWMEIKVWLAAKPAPATESEHGND